MARIDSRREMMNLESGFRAKMKTLYVVGNGFDLYHGLDTHYRSFGLSLKSNYSEIYDQLLEFFGLPDLSEIDALVHPLWGDFENSLSLLDSDTVFEAHSDSLARPGAEDFRDRDWNTFAIEIEMVVNRLTTKLLAAFRIFIQEVKFPDLSSSDRLALSPDAFYMSFNYTDTLERFYKIPHENILYIHGRAGDDRELILGHGIDPENFKEPPARPPDGLSSEELEQWMDNMSDRYDHSFELGRQALQKYFLKSFKDTQTLIGQNPGFFDSLAHVEKVYILGHSLSEVDQPYINKIIGSLNAGAKFWVSYYSESEHESHIKTLLNLGVGHDRLQMIKIGDLVSPDV